MRPGWLLVLGAVIGVVVGFGVGHYVMKPATPTPTTTTSLVTTTTLPQPSVTVTPTSGPIGTEFSLAAHNFRPGGSVHFEIDFPGGHVFAGQAHAVGADGAVSTTYVATKGNPAGTYQVKAIDDQGTAAQSTLVVGNATATSSASATTTTVAARTSTTR